MITKAAIILMLQCHRKS